MDRTRCWSTAASTAPTRRAIVYCESAEDVEKTVRWAGKHAIRIVPRCGGHSYAGYSTTSEGVVVDVSRLRHVHAHDGTATVGAGARLIDVYSGLAAHGSTIPAGSCPTVGIAGLALGAAAAAGTSGSRRAFVSEPIGSARSRTTRSPGPGRQLPAPPSPGRGWRPTPPMGSSRPSRWRRARPKGHVLRYGSRWTHAEVTCRSRTSGLTCRNRAGHGFFLSRQRSYRFSRAPRALRAPRF